MDALAVSNLTTSINSIIWWHNWSTDIELTIVVFCPCLWFAILHCLDCPTTALCCVSLKNKRSDSFVAYGKHLNPNLYSEKAKSCCKWHTKLSVGWMIVTYCNKTTLWRSLTDWPSKQQQIINICGYAVNTKLCCNEYNSKRAAMYWKRLRKVWQGLPLLWAYVCPTASSCYHYKPCQVTRAQGHESKCSIEVTGVTFLLSNSLLHTWESWVRQNGCPSKYGVDTTSNN